MKTTFILVFLMQTIFVSAQDNLHQPITYNRIASDHAAKQIKSAPAWTNFSKDHGKWYVEFDMYTGLPARALGGNLPLQTSSLKPNQIMGTFCNKYLVDFNIPIEDFNILSDQTHNGIRNLVYRQVIPEATLEQSYFQLKINSKDEVIFFGTTAFDTKALPQTTWANSNKFHTAIRQFTSLDDVAITLDKPVIRTSVINGDYRLHRAYRYEVISTKTGNPLHLSIDVDEQTGQILESIKLNCSVHNSQHSASECSAKHPTGINKPNASNMDEEQPSSSSSMAGVTLVMDVVYNPLQPIFRDQGVRNLEVEINGSNFYTNWDGLIEGYTPSIGDQLIYKLRGQWANVFNTTASVRAVDTIVISTISDTINISSSFSGHDRAGYLHTDKIWTHFEVQTGDTLLRNWAPLEVNVLVDGSCNAFYRNNTINFFKPSTTCPSTVLFSDVVYHEFGHFINSKWPGPNNSQMRNGAINEGYADFWSLSISEYPILGEGWRTMANTNVRRYDINPKRFPQDIVFQVHGDGEIICGAWWDTYKLLGDDVETALDIFIGATRNYADYVNDYGEQFRSILIEALFADDDDGTFTNGTPNAPEIIQGFAMHGITLLFDLDLQHQEVVQANPQEDVVIDALAVSFIQGLGSFLNQVKLNYRVNGGAWQNTSMSNLGNEYFQGTIPGQPAGSVVQYFITTSDAFNNPGSSGPYGMIANNPERSNIPYSYIVGFDKVFEQNLENLTTPFTIDPDGNDGATAGQWSYGKPKATIDGSGAYVQPQFDHTPNNGNNACYFTGQSTDLFNIDQNDVEFGKTSLQTTAFDISNYTDPILEFWRWFSNGNANSSNPQNDLWEAYISSDGVSWIPVDYTYAHEPQWRKVQFKIRNYIPTGNSIQLKFVTSDSLKGAPATGIGQSIVEAAIDDIAIYDLLNVGTNLVQKENLFQVYPNPSNGTFVVQLDPRTTGMITMELLDMSGKVLTEKQYLASTNIPVSFDVPNGIYAIRITNESLTHSRKILINFNL